MTTNSMAISYEAGATSVPKGLTVLAGRFFFALIFLMSAPFHFTKDAIGYAVAQGVPFAGLAVPASGILALIGGLSILLGYHVRIGAWLIVLFLVPVTFMMHNFWAATDPGMAQIQMTMFMKNIALIGGALLISQFGAGPFSLDARSRRTNESN